MRSNGINLRSAGKGQCCKNPVTTLPSSFCRHSSLQYDVYIGALGYILWSSSTTRSAPPPTNQSWTRATFGSLDCTLINLAGANPRHDDPEGFDNDYHIQPKAPVLDVIEV